MSSRNKQSTGSGANSGSIISTILSGGQNTSKPKSKTKGFVKSAAKLSPRFAKRKLLSLSADNDNSKPKSPKNIEKGGKGNSGKKQLKSKRGEEGEKKRNRRKSTKSPANRNLKKGRNTNLATKSSNLKSRNKNDGKNERENSKDRKRDNSNPQDRKRDNSRDEKRDNSKDQEKLSVSQMLSKRTDSKKTSHKKGRSVDSDITCLRKKNQELKSTMAQLNKELSTIADELKQHMDKQDEMYRDARGRSRDRTCRPTNRESAPGHYDGPILSTGVGENPATSVTATTVSSTQTVSSSVLLASTVEITTTTKMNVVALPNSVSTSTSTISTTAAPTQNKTTTVKSAPVVRSLKVQRIKNRKNRSVSQGSKKSNPDLNRRITVLHMREKQATLTRLRHLAEHAPWSIESPEMEQIRSLDKQTTVLNELVTISKKEKGCLTVKELVARHEKIRAENPATRIVASKNPGQVLCFSEKRSSMVWRSKPRKQSSRSNSVGKREQATPDITRAHYESRVRFLQEQIRSLQKVMLESHQWISYESNPFMDTELPPDSIYWRTKYLDLQRQQLEAWLFEPNDLASWHRDGTRPNASHYGSLHKAQKEAVQFLIEAQHELKERKDEEFNIESQLKQSGELFLTERKKLQSRKDYLGKRIGEQNAYNSTIAALNIQIELLQKSLLESHELLKEQKSQITKLRNRMNIKNNVKKNTTDMSSEASAKFWRMKYQTLQKSKVMDWIFTEGDITPE